MQINNRTIFNKDNLDILQGIDSDTIDLIYLDPPFNKKKQFIAPMGSSAEGASFNDLYRLQDIKDEWVISIEQDTPKLHDFLIGIKKIDGKQSYNYCYIAYMAIRLIECHRILKPTGSLYLHCDPTMSHYLKIALDCIFGDKNFINEIAWCYKKLPNNAKMFQRNKDIILFYAKSENYIFHKQYSHPTKQSLKTFETGRRIGYNANHSKKMVTVFDWDKYQQAIKNNKIPKDLKPIEFKDGKPLMRDYWDDIKILGGSKNKERTGYPTQKPLELLRRIIAASSNEGDIVLDPFCGCATTCIAAEQLNRKWIGIDISVKAYDLVRERLAKEVSDTGDILKYKNKVYFQTTVPARTDMGADTPIQKCVYIISNPSYPNDYKVGVAKNVHARLNSYQTSDPDRGYKLEYSVLTPYFTELEKHIHDILPNKYEWIQNTDLATIKQKIDDFIANKTRDLFSQAL